MSMWTDADGNRCNCAECTEGALWRSDWNWTHTEKTMRAAKKQAIRTGKPVIVATQKREEVMHVDV